MARLGHLVVLCAVFGLVGAVYIAPDHPALSKPATAITADSAGSFYVAQSDCTVSQFDVKSSKLVTSVPLGGIHCQLVGNALIDDAAEFAYFTRNESGALWVDKAPLQPLELAVGQLFVGPAAASQRCFAIASGFLYVGTAEAVVKIRQTDFTIVGSIPLLPDELGAKLHCAAKWDLYVGASSSLHVTKMGFDQNGNFSRLLTLPLPVANSSKAVNYSITAATSTRFGEYSAGNVYFVASNLNESNTDAFIYRVDVTAIHPVIGSELRWTDNKDRPYAQEVFSAAVDDGENFLYFSAHRGVNVVDITKNQKVPNWETNCRWSNNHSHVVVLPGPAAPFLFGIDEKGNVSKIVLDCPTQGPASVRDASTGICNECPPGTALTFWEGNSQCGICGEGTYSVYAGSYSCELCPPGYSNPSKQASTACTPCPLNYYTDSHGYVNCQQCPAGTHTDVIGSTVCTPN